MQWIMLSLMFMFNFMFLNMKHPLSMGLTLLIQTMLISTMTGLTSKSFWFSYILFLVFLGGMLVLFLYVTSLASNEMFSFSNKLFLMMMLILMSNMSMLYFIDKNLLMQFKNLEMNSIKMLETYFLENSLSLNKLYNYPNNLFTILLMIYLLISLIVVIKITNLFQGPLRPMFN
uniref:NADH-ubiquinone oxidoreductase chain 6 n=1 Tax=Strongygaster brasiliensis TaxID=1985198 RepID=A0A343YVS7_9MUSC|nr:NADH dehydrogenase subunit 6 [Strongygaster brasiliensis]